MKKALSKILLCVVLICVVVAACFLVNQKIKKDSSFLNYKNLVSVAKQSEALSVVKSGDESSSYIIDGTQLAQFLDTANWTSQTLFTRNVRRYTEQNSRFSLQINLDSVYLKIFDTDTAIIHDGITGTARYYKMSEGDYEKILAMLSLSEH